MKVMIVSVGTPRMPGLAEAIRDYESRISHYFRFESAEVRQQRIGPGADSGAIIEKESRALLDKVQPDLETVAIDERGVTWSSEQLAAYLGELAIGGGAGVAFLVGGPLGLSDELRGNARRVLSLSSFTLPHELARLVLAEQIYRAGTILRGEPYHKGG
ncbi:MAG: 23S rRNA (pseudouridine(1915)-N(3))-methyltransferase RlmH [Gemmatimonadetes bacterium]|nr:23S rRNA (pseudouridine(1915)-N(3))-methyltransferase RlmH [Gemmatimonadota bacterium]NIO30866.1 23S rRNA (pseudouridine(1915)-N(3))-methyltransferase RlmH [Gemmatimonadota bacterium]